MEFRKELESLINKYSRENGSDTPDFILAEYLENCLDAFDEAPRNRKKYFTAEEPPSENVQPGQ